MRFLIIGTALLVLAACSPLQTTTPVPPVGAPTATVAPAAPGATGSAPAAQPSQSAAPAAPSANAGPLTLQVLSPQDGAVVSTSQVTVTGAAAPGEVVTVNDDIILVGADGAFQSDVSLSEGPNLIEVIASNDSGDETTLELTVTYQP